MFVAEEGYTIAKFIKDLAAGYLGSENILIGGETRDEDKIRRNEGLWGFFSFCGTSENLDWKWILQGVSDLF